MRKRQFVALGCAALAALAGVAADRTPDGYGLVNALAGWTVSSGDPWPFYYYASAIDGGSGSQGTSTITRDNANAWAPACVYQLERYGKTMTTTFTGLVPNATYKVELHLTENFFGGTCGGTGTGARIWNVSFNGVVAEENIDIYKEAGGAFKGLCKQYETTADANGQIAVQTTTVKDNGHFSGMAVFGTAVPSDLSFTASHGSVDVDVTFSGKDVLRYYLEKATSASGPWTQVAVYEPHLVSGRLAGVYDPAVTTYYRVVASNGVGTVASPAVSFTASGATDHLATTGATVADNPSAYYAIDSVGDPTAGNNTLAADAVTATSYKLSADGDSILDLLADQVFTVGLLGVDNFARKLTVQGDGTLAARNGLLALSAGNAGAEVEIAATLSGGTGGTGNLVKNGEGRVSLTGPVTGFSTIYANEGELAVKTPADGSMPGDVAGAGAFVKTGANTLTLTNALAGLSGDLVVREGTLRFGKTGSLLPDATGRLVIENGAALDVSTGLANYGVVLGERKVVVSGAGPDGQGAIVNTAEDIQYSALRVGELAGDAVFGGTTATKNADKSRWDFRNSGSVGSFAMNGHNIRKVGNNMVCFTGIALTEGGPVHIDVDAGYWSSETTTSYSGGPENAFNVAAGATLDFYSMTKPITWMANLADGAELKFRYGTMAHNQYTGPITLAAGAANIYASSGQMGTISGAISGEGTLRSVSGSAGRVVLTGTNTYTGGTFVNGGDLWVESRESLPDYSVAGKISVTNGSLLVRAEEGYWREADLQTICRRGALFNSSGSCLGAYVLAGGLATWTEAFSLPHGSFAKGGDGTLALKGDLTASKGYLATREGTMVLDGGTHAVQQISGRAASTLVLTNGASLAVSVVNGQSSTIGYDINKQTTLVVGPDSTLAGTADCAVGAASAALLVGYNAGTGLLLVDGGTVRHKLNLGVNDVKAQGAVIQNGGFVENQGGAANDIRVGEAGYGYYELNDGELDWWGYGTIGCNAGAYGVMVQHGGLFKYIAKSSAGRLGLSRGGDGTFYMDGGAIDFTPSSCFLALGESDSSTSGAGTQTSFTIDGEGVARFRNGSVWLGNRKDHTSSVNLNGGVFEGGWFEANSNFDSTNRETLVSLLNFNGGTFRSAGNNNLTTTQVNKKIDAVTVYEGGAVFDPAGFSETVNIPLERPAGDGVASIPLPDGLASATWLVGAPHVKITGGGGRGATALCVYDSATRKVTGVKVTCPGTGYTEAPTVTFHGGGRTNVYTVTATLAANAVTGGLTVRSSTGTGMVRLTAANTFGGPVKIESGTLQLVNPAGFPEGADLILDGGSFNAMGHTVTAGVVTVRGGAFANGTLVCNRIVKEGTGDFLLGGAHINATAVPGVVITEGRVLVSGAGAGLYEGVLSGSQNWTDPNPCTAIELSTTKANTTSGWSDNTTAVYSGYIWNRSNADVTWTFAEFVDDYARVWIDDELVVTGASWTDVGLGTVTLSPGGHKFEARFGQDTGGAGPSSNGPSGNPPSPAGWAGKYGFAVDYQGRGTDDVNNFEIPMDPGDGSLFTILAGGDISPFAGEVTVSEGAQLVADGIDNLPIGTLQASGVATNGDVTVTTALLAHGADLAAGRHLVVAAGGFALAEGARVKVDGFDALSKGTQYVLAEAADGVTLPTQVTLVGAPAGTSWMVYRTGKKLVLGYPTSTVLYLR